MISYGTCHFKIVNVIADHRTTAVQGGLPFNVFLNITLMIGAFRVVIIDDF